THHEYLSLESRQMVLDDESAHAALEACQKGLYSAQPVLVYIADSISDDAHQVPYSVVAAVGPVYESTGVSLPVRRSSGMVLGKTDISLRDNEIILTEWPGSPLFGKPGDKITLVYYQLDQHGRLEKKSESLRLRARVLLSDDIDDPDWTPEF